MALAPPLVADVQTPCLVVYRDVLEVNLVAMAARARDHLVGTATARQDPQVFGDCSPPACARRGWPDRGDRGGGGGFRRRWLHRPGVAPEGAGQVAAAARRFGLGVAGVFTFPGHSYGPGRRNEAALDEARALQEAIGALSEHHATVTFAADAPLPELGRSFGSLRTMSARLSASPMYSSSPLADQSSTMAVAARGRNA